jgi:hypothetical protein
MTGQNPNIGAVLRIAIAGALLALTLAGCGSGAGSHNFDEGTFIDNNGDKSIVRTLENDTDMGIDVDLLVNGDDYLGTPFIAPHDIATVTINGLAVSDRIEFVAHFDNGDTTRGSFSEDGRTVFTNSRAAGTGGIRIIEQNGSAAVSHTGTQLQYRVTRKGGVVAPPAK